MLSCRCSGTECHRCAELKDNIPTVILNLKKLSYEYFLKHFIEEDTLLSILLLENGELTSYVDKIRSNHNVMCFVSKTVFQTPSFKTSFTKIDELCFPGNECEPIARILFCDEPLGLKLHNGETKEVCFKVIFGDKSEWNFAENNLCYTNMQNEQYRLFCS